MSGSESLSTGIPSFTVVHKSRLVRLVDLLVGGGLSWVTLAFFEWVWYSVTLHPHHCPCLSNVSFQSHMRYYNGNCLPGNVFSLHLHLCLPIWDTMESSSRMSTRPGMGSCVTERCHVIVLCCNIKILSDLPNKSLESCQPLPLWPLALTASYPSGISR